MKQFLTKIAKSKAFWISFMLIVQTLVYIVAGMGKAYIHMDEAYSYGSANYNKLEILDEENFNNRWHPAEYYRAYLVADWYERWDFEPVYTNQRDDVHPPLFHLFLRLLMELTPGEFTVWTGIGLNIVVFAVNSVFIYLIIEKLLGKDKNRETKAGILTLVAGITLAAVSTVIYVRMYAMLAMFITITMYLHMRLLETKKLHPKLLAGIGIMALLGVLTQYYYLFALLPMFVVTMVQYARTKRWKEMWAYVGAIGAAGVASLLIWPYSIQHMFFGYRGQGAMENLLNFTNLGAQVGIFAGVLTLYGFHLMLPILVIGMFVAAIYGLKRGKKLELERVQDRQFKMLIWTGLVFFVVVAVISPYTSLRYLEGVTSLIFVAVMLGLYFLLGVVMKEKTRNIIMVAVLAVTVILPIPAKLEPDVMYSRWATVTEFVEENRETPLLYVYDQDHNNRFLDDIVLFTEAEWSYIMTEQEYTVANFRQVLETRDLSKGLMVMINYGNELEAEEYLDALQIATGFKNREYVFRLNAADLYYLR